MPRCTVALLLAAALGLAALLVVTGALSLPTSIVRALPAQSPAACIPINFDITATTTWRADCYRVTTNTVTINPDVVLSIIPDTSTRIEFAPAASLVVRGSLQALGASDRPITFTSAVSQTACAWAGIIFDIDSPANGNLIQRATIE